MTIERTLRLVAGAFVLASLALGVEGSPLFLSQHALWFTAFVGLNLLQSGFSNWCPMISLLRKLGMKSGDLAHA